MQKLLIILSFIVLNAVQAVAKPNCKEIDAMISAKEDFVEVALAGKAAEASSASLSALEEYRGLVAQFELSLPTTLHVAMLDYAGFKLKALMAAKIVDWKSVIVTHEEANQNWSKTISKVKDKAILDLVTNTLATVDSAIADQNVKWVDGAAQILLDSVDLIEQQVKNPAKGACH
jgi:hypothetical protein